MAETNMIYIDVAAANADVFKLRNAIVRLEESESSIKKLSANGGSMIGETGQAITEKCSALSFQINTLKGNLNTTIRLIQAAVKEYQQKDQELAVAIKNGGV